MSYRYYRNSEGYPDPTAGAAIRNVMREYRRREQLTKSNRRKSMRKQHRQQHREMAANQKTLPIPTVTKEAASYER